MVMWDHNPQGQMESSLNGFANLWRTDLEEAAYIIYELEINKIADVEYFDKISNEEIIYRSDCFRGLSPECPDLSPGSPAFVTLASRRMFREWKARQYEREKKAKQRAKKDSPAFVPAKSLPLSSSSSSSSPSNKEKDIQLSVVLRDNSEFQITEEKILEYQKAYPNINVEHELRMLCQWNIDNPGKRKTKIGILRHINSWLMATQKKRIEVQIKPQPDGQLKYQIRPWTEVKAEKMKED